MKPFILAMILSGLLSVQLAPAKAPSQDATLYDSVRPRNTPDGPRISDVCFSSRWYHPLDSTDPHQTLDAISSFHVTKVMWMYVGPEQTGVIAEMKKQGVTVQGAINTDVNQSLPEAKDVKKDLNDSPIPWRWDRMHLCPNAPSTRPYMLEWAARLLKQGIDEIQIDDPEFWAFSQIQLPHESKPRLENCYCDYCMAGFREFLKARTPEERRAAGISDADTFNYREYLLAHNMPPNRLDTPLEKMYGEFGKASLTTFWNDFRDDLDAENGRHVTLSSNNFGGIWQPIVGPFNFGVAELPEVAATPPYIYEKLRGTFALGKGQVFTAMSRKVDETRKRIATVTACGGNMLVPWDVFMGVNAARHFGSPIEYADIYGFIRANARYLDGYEDAAVTGKDIKDDRYKAQPPLQLPQDSDVFAIARVNPQDRSAPVAVHLVDWSETPQAFTLKINTTRIQKTGAFTCELLLPKAYDKEEHDSAQSSGNFTGLTTKAPLESVKIEGGINVTIPALHPWGILLIRTHEPSSPHTHAYP